ncbi:MAG: winged helix-turn-helix transcriptional regulator [Candidatus Goldbacteria bacterium]|nr:winged helix-turn-helix transcriptional regulator [Candidatus Goldiibacteriota bacterium]
MEELIKAQSEICKTFSNPNRLKIIKLLCVKEQSASQIIKQTGLGKANLSQHMSVLSNKGIVLSRKQGQSVFYSIADERIPKVCMMMGEITMSTLERKKNIYEKGRKNINRRLKP